MHRDETIDQVQSATAGIVDHGVAAPAGASGTPEQQLSREDRHRCRPRLRHVRLDVRDEAWRTPEPAEQLGEQPVLELQRGVQDGTEVRYARDSLEVFRRDV